MLGCSPKIKYIPTIHYEKEYLVDTIINHIIEKEYISIITEDTSSQLSNSYSNSICSISNGKLHHSLYSKDTIIPFKIVYKNYKIIDSIPFPVEVIKYQTKTNPITLYIIIGLLVIVLFLVIRYVR